MCFYLASCLFTFTLIGHLAHCAKQTAFHTSGTWGLWYSGDCSKPHKLETKAVISIIKAKIASLLCQWRVYFQCKNIPPLCLSLSAEELFYVECPPPTALTPYCMVPDDVTYLTFHYTLAEPTQLDSQPTMKFKLVIPNLFYKFQHCWFGQNFSVIFMPEVKTRKKEN